MEEEPPVGSECQDYTTNNNRYPESLPSMSQTWQWSLDLPRFPRNSNNPCNVRLDFDTSSGEPASGTGLPAWRMVDVANHVSMKGQFQKGSLSSLQMLTKEGSMPEEVLLVATDVKPPTTKWDCAPGGGFGVTSPNLQAMLFRCCFLATSCDRRRCSDICPHSSSTMTVEPSARPVIRNSVQ